MFIPRRKKVFYVLSIIILRYDIFIFQNCHGKEDKINKFITKNSRKNFYNIPYDLSEGSYREKNPKQITTLNKDYFSTNSSNIFISINNKEVKSDKDIENNIKIRINTPKRTDFDDEISFHNNETSFNKLQKSRQNKLIFNIDALKSDSDSSSTLTLIDRIHNMREKSLKNFNRGITFNKDFPEEWYRILEDGRKKKEYVFFYEVPLIEKSNNDYSTTTQSIRLNTEDLNRNKNRRERIHSTHDRKNDVERKRTSKIVTEDQFVFNPDVVSEDGVKPPVISERFLNIFQIVSFNNQECYSASGVKGICLHPLECEKNAGISTGTCAEGYGVCCVYQYSCGDQTSYNCSNFINPNFPKASSERLSCTFTVYKSYPEVTQLRLEIVQLELQPPTNGTCVEDQFVVTGQNINNVIPILCGINNDQNMYVEVGNSPGPFYLSVMTSRPAERLIQVRVCQLGPRDDRAPAGCLQYHTSPTGFIESFNYRADGSLPQYRQPGYTNNLNYAICISRAPNTCSITYTNYDINGDYEFQILNYDADGVPLLPPGQAGAEVFNCPDDYIVVNGIRLCGEKLNDASLTEDFTVNAPVTETSSGPIVFTFRTNGNVTGRGFRLAYRQNPCTVYG